MAAPIVNNQPIRTFRPERSVRENENVAMQLALGKGDLWLAAGNYCWRAIVCLQGIIWVTQERDLRDHVLAAGEMFLISQPGKVVVQALADARMQITPSLAATPCGSRYLEDTILP